MGIPGRGIVVLAQMRSQQVPTKPFDYRIVDQMVVGRQTAGIPQKGRINAGPASIFHWQNDPLRSAVDERVTGGSQMEAAPTQPQANTLAMLPGLEQVSF